MEGITIINLRDHADLLESAAKWYGSKWGIPAHLYVESIEQAIRHPDEVPQWYLVLKEQEIIGGLGVIENDFHKRKEVTPNVCAVFVEKEYRKMGIAKQMLQYACDDLKRMGYKDAYLLTDHKDFYEKCGWEFYDMIEENGGEFSRGYHISIQ